MKQTILTEFNNNHLRLDKFKKKIEFIISELLHIKKIDVHQITGRIKDKISLEEKIDRKNGKYKNISDITDIVGLRIITYLESDVDKIAEIIESEFTIDVQNSVDKRKLRSDQFGYRSLHYVISLDNTRAKITENKVFESLKAEIQIRSILQHAWAEIEHELGYKGKFTVPDDYIRSFNRLAALLETADKEFVRLKQNLSEYEKNITEYIFSSPQTVELNQASLISFTRSNKIMQKALELISKNTGAEITSGFEYGGIIEKFKEYFKITTIKDLQDKLKADHHEYLHFVNIFTIGLKYEKLSESLPIFYYQHYLASKHEDPNRLNEYFDFGQHHIDKNNNAVARFINVYREAKMTTTPI